MCGKHGVSLTSSIMNFLETWTTSTPNLSPSQGLHNCDTADPKSITIDCLRRTSLFLNTFQFNAFFKSLKYTWGKRLHGKSQRSHFTVLYLKTSHEHNLINFICVWVPCWGLNWGPHACKVDLSYSSRLFLHETGSHQAAQAEVELTLSLTQKDPPSSS